MTKTNLPPQAYTKETLVQAFEWLKSQPQHIKDSAKSPDLLVSLYLHACRYGRTPSSMQFQKDLKHLAKNIQEFEKDDDLPPLQRHAPDPSQPTTAPTDTKDLNLDIAHEKSHLNPYNRASAPHRASHSPPSSQQRVIKEKISLERTLPQNTSIYEQLDQRSQSAVQQVQEELNLSHPDEALRVLLTLGLDSFQKKFHL